MEKSIINLTIHNISKSLREGEIKPYELETELFLRTKSSYSNDNEAWLESCKTAQKLRSEFLTEKTGISLSHTSDAHVSSGLKRKDRYVTRIENMYGAVETPVGFAGPLKITGFENNEHLFSGSFYIPLATNEAALVAGINRGCKYVDGVKTIITKDGMTRAPAIECPNKEYADKVIGWIQSKENFQLMKNEAEKTTSHGKLLDVEVIRGEKHPNVIYPRFRADTGDAMGMNMVTIMVDGACKILEKEFPDIDVVALSGNLCSDKKQTRINKERGRGLSVKTSVVISKEKLEHGEVSAKRIEKINYLKNSYGSELAGTIGGYNGHASNAIAAMYASTGQDLAQIVESSICATRANALDNGDLEFGCELPCIEVGTVGGGTDTPTVSENLKLLGVFGSGNPQGSNRKKLGCIVASAVTAAEYNILLTEARKELAKTHAKLTGRI
jgi:hydroxymethylglutaryl-CoA reductase (NADPH)